MYINTHSSNSGFYAQLEEKGEELCGDLREVYDILFYEEFDDMDKFVKLRNYYADLKHKYDDMLTSVDNLLPVKSTQVPNKTLLAKL